MMNEGIFIVQAFLVACTALICLRLGKEALIAFICVQCILTNLFVIKLTTLCTLTATCADTFSIGAVLGLNLLQEFYGKQMARKTIYLSFFLLLFYALITYIHLAYIPHPADTTHQAFSTILTSMPRIVVASFVVYALVQLLDTWLYARLKQWFAHRYLLVRICISIGLCQLLDTILFSYAGLYGLADNIGHIIIVSYGVKLIALVIALPFVALVKKLR
jgi:uncharacterized integral membrane protein (TIGR00697 family)